MPQFSDRPANSKLTPEQYARMRAEAEAPYRILRQLIYLAFGASGLIGGLIFFGKLLGGQDVGSTLPNLALQIGVVVLMVFLFRWEQRTKNQRSQDK